MVSDAIAPHYCCSCGEIGSILCEHCKYNIMSEPYCVCMVCGEPRAWGHGVCSTHGLSYSRAWCLGEKHSGLEALIYAYKFGHNKASYKVSADMLDTVLPQLPRDCIVTTVPTIATHIRQRGYDHTALIAREFARLRGLPYRGLLVRRDNTRQQGASRKQRLAQAKSAFACEFAEPTTHLLIDDVFTTGATAQYAALRLREAGATDVWLAVLARQPLEK